MNSILIAVEGVFQNVPLPLLEVWGRFGFIDAFNDQRNWYADTFLAVDQGPIIVMIENYRSGLLWKLFMSIPEIQSGLRKLGFSSPHLDTPVS